LTYLSLKDISKDDAVLYISKEIFVNDLAKFKGSDWARGLLMYAVVGVPLVNGNQVVKKDYGYHIYDKDSIWISETKFDAEKICTLNFTKNIIITKSFLQPEFSVIECNRR
jgi:hypothetical protein